MNKIYEKAKDLHTAATYVYSEYNEMSMAYKNPECTIEYTPAELYEIWLSGKMLIVGEDRVVYKPLWCAVKDTEKEFTVEIDFCYPDEPVDGKLYGIAGMVTAVYKK